MNQKRLFIDEDLCFGCHACEVACKQENRHPADIKWVSVRTVGPKMIGGRLVMRFVPMTCVHCGRAPCMGACPEGAIFRRDDGVVLIDPDRCIGCLACLQACPFGAPQYNPERGIVEKCNLCVQRVDKGLKPACVQACQAGAILFGAIHEITERLRQRRASRRRNLSLATDLLRMA